MSHYQSTLNQLTAQPKKWLVTGAAGFIGSHLVEKLLSIGQSVVGLDNFATGHKKNLEEVRSIVGEDNWSRFSFYEGDIGELTTCQAVCAGEAPGTNFESGKGTIDYVLHQAALGSVPRSIEDPIRTNQANIGGFLNMLVAARDQRVKRFVYAASSSTYGDHPDLPKVEERIGRPLSPYAVTKYVNELYADVFARCYKMETIGLRYFNVFGPRQDPNGPYAAVIPRWISAMARNEPVFINGDGDTTRDFCFVANAVQANILAATAEDPEAVNQVYNVAVNARTSLNQLFEILRANLLPRYPHLKNYQPHYRDFREGDVRHSQADTSKVNRLLGYVPTHTVEEGLQES